MSTVGILIAAGVAAAVVVILAVVIIRNKKKKEEIARYQRPRAQSLEGAYFEPEDNTMAPTAYGSMTYATNTYGQNLYGQEPASPTGALNGGTGNGQKAPFVEEEDPSGLSLEFLKRSDEERWRREHESYAKPVTENFNPLYGTVPEKKEVIKNS